MGFQHASVYVVRVVDTDEPEGLSTWFVGPYGSTRADQVAAHLESIAIDTRQCYVEPLFSDDDCLQVSSYRRAGSESLH